MSKAFLIDIARCCGCYNCQLACKDEHVDNDWRPYAAPQPNIGQFWMKLREYERGTLPKVKLHYIPVLCAHCENASCMAACASGAITRREDGLVLISPETCSGCGACADACALGAIYLNEDLGLAQKCTGCAHLLDDGRTEPRCVGVCPTGALRYMEEAEIPSEAVGLIPAENGPRVRYLHIPGRFVAGTVLNSNGTLVVSGAEVSLQAEDGSVLRTETDEFGDFWLENAPESASALMITSGELSLGLSVPAGQDSLNLGELRLQDRRSH